MSSSGALVLMQDVERLGVVKSIVLGLVEGLTEFLPISSTGHLIVANAWLGHTDPAFEIAIQAGAITAILVLYGHRVVQALLAIGGSGTEAGAPRVNLLWLLVVAALPAAVLGKLLSGPLERLFHPLTVATTLTLGGILLLLVERWTARRAAAQAEIASMTLAHALRIGLWQTLALIPGVSRSGATIVGGIMTGYSRTAAAEFSFLVGLPILYGACLLKVADDFERLTGPMLPDLLVASAAAFVSALIVVKPFVRFLQRHTFVPFAIYRIVAGIAVAVLWRLGYLGE